MTPRADAVQDGRLATAEGGAKASLTALSTASRCCGRGVLPVTGAQLVLPERGHRRANCFPETSAAARLCFLSSYRGEMGRHPVGCTESLAVRAQARPNLISGTRHPATLEAAQCQCKNASRRSPHDRRTATRGVKAPVTSGFALCVSGFLPPPAPSLGPPPLTPRVSAVPDNTYVAARGLR
jgi:hypothetical protein